MALEEFRAKGERFWREGKKKRGERIDMGYMVCFEEEEEGRIEEEKGGGRERKLHKLIY